MIYWNEKEKLCVNHFRGLKGLISHSVELEILSFFIVTSVNELTTGKFCYFTQPHKIFFLVAK